MKYKIVNWASPKVSLKLIHNAEFWIKENTSLKSLVFYRSLEKTKSSKSFEKVMKRL